MKQKTTPYPYIVFLRFNGTPSRDLPAAIEAVTGNPPKFLMADGADKSLIGVLWPRTATDLWAALIKTRKLVNVAEMMIIAAADDWCAEHNRPGTGWLIRNLGDQKAKPEPLHTSD